MKILPMYATVFSTWMSAFAFIGGMAYFHEQGPIYMTTVGWDALFAILFISVGKRIWHYGRVHNYYTPTDFFDDIYDSEILNLIVTAISVVCTMIYLQVQIVGGLLAMEISTGGNTRSRVHNLLCHTGYISVGGGAESRGLGPTPFTEY